jgi:membrane-associated phospholipid phosphatase
VGYSRIYLSQHFAIDVLVGSFVGVSMTIFCKFYFDKYTMKWADGSLRDVFSRK